MSSRRGKMTRGLWLAALAVLIPAIAAHPVHANSRQNLSRTTSITANPQGPLLLLVSLRKQRVRVFDVNGEIASSRISSGMPGFDTPTGVFSLLEKNQYHESNIYAGAPMPFMQRLTWSGIALHAGVVPGYRASHGCVRLPYSFARSLFGITKLGSRVVVTGEETEPVRFSHPNLFKPLPQDAPSAAVVAKVDEPRVAANDQGPEGANVNRLFGVTPALAQAVAELPPSENRAPTTRAEADRMFNDKLVRLQAQAKAAERARMSATDRAKVAVRDADAARSKLDAARRAMEPLQAAVALAQKREEDSLRDFSAAMAVAYAATPVSLRDARSTPAITTEEQEEDLENAVLDATRATSAAREALARAELDFAGVQAAFAAADAARTAAIDGVRKNQIDLRTAQTALIEANKETVRRLKPVSVFVSLRSQKVYVRQGVEPVMEATASSSLPMQSRIGTHVFTAMRYAPEDPDSFEWHLVSAHTPGAGDIFDPGNKRKKRREASPQSTSVNIEAATAALDSIELPQDVLAKLTELARPGASLIISDRDLPTNENGPGTEFVVLTR